MKYITLALSVTALSLLSSASVHAKVWPTLNQALQNPSVIAVLPPAQVLRDARLTKPISPKPGSANQIDAFKEPVVSDFSLEAQPWLRGRQ